MLSITVDEIRRIIPESAYRAGLDYQFAGHVEAVSLSRDGTALKARVRGTARRPYEQTIRFSRSRSGDLTVIGSCTCPVSYNCKHVAAALLEWQERNGDAAAGSVAARLLPPRSADADPAGGRAPGALPPEVMGWLNTLEAAREQESEDYPPTVRRRLLYLLRAGPWPAGPALDLVGIELRSDGTVSERIKDYIPHQLYHPAQQPRFLRPSDRRIVHRLVHLSGPAEGSSEFLDTLRLVIATGRGRWGSPEGPVLAEGPPIAASVAWRGSERGTQRPEFELPEGLVALRLAVPCYADPRSGTIGPLQLDLPPRVVRALIAAPELPPEAARQVREELARRLPGLSLPLPRELPPPETLKGPPAPHLLLFAAEMPFGPWGPPRVGGLPGPLQGAAARLPLASPSFQYGPVRVPAVAEPNPTVLQDGRLYRVLRDRKAESAALTRLRAMELGPLATLLPGLGRHPLAEAWLLRDEDPGAWIDIMLHEVPALREAGWTVEVAEDFPLRLAFATEEVTAEIAEGSGIDWFDLGLGVMVEGERVDLLPALLDMIRRIGPIAPLLEDAADDEEAGPLLVPLPDGRLLAVPLTRLRGFLAVLLELFAGRDPELVGGRLRLARSDAADLALLEAAGEGGAVAWRGGEALRALGRQLRDAGGIPGAALPADFAATLRPYQARGVDWLQFLRAAGLGGILADDMGLGKTVQTLAHLAIEQDAGRLDRPALVICPTSLVANWRAEAARFAPRLRVLALHGPERKQRFPDIAAHDLVITTYPLLGRDHEALTAQDWHLVVLDEAQTIKNPQAGTTRIVGRLRGRQRLCLSGTPLENHLGELWSLFDFLMPGFLGSRQGFARQWRTPIERGGDPARQALLARRVAPFLLRRTKAEVAAELPPRTEILETIELGAAQRTVYEGIRLAMHAKVRQAVAERGLAGSGIVILDALLKLRQACCDPRLLPLDTAKAAKAGSAKLERLMEMLPEMLEEGRRILLFSQFTSMLALIEQELDRARMPFVMLTGDTRDRATPVQRFQGGEVPLFLVSLKAGGVGLNLTAADTVIHYDPWWNPAVENQATDRAHRIGQDKPVFVHRLISEGTIETKMESLKARKQALVAGILGAGSAATLAITVEELETLFAPA